MEAESGGQSPQPSTGIERAPAALQPLRADLPAGAQPRGEAAFVARPAVAQDSACVALPTAAGSLRALRSASAALGRAVGAGEQRPGRLGGGPDEASELARSRPSLRLEKRGPSSGARSPMGLPGGGASRCTGLASTQPAQGTSLPHGGLIWSGARCCGWAKTAPNRRCGSFSPSWAGAAAAPFRWC